MNSTSSASGLTTVASTVSVALRARIRLYEVQELLKFKLRWGRPYVLVRLAGCDASRDTVTRSRWTTLPTVRRPVPHLRGPRAALSLTPGRPHRCRLLLGRPLAYPALPPAGFTRAIDAAPPGDLRAELVGRTLPYWWPDDRVAAQYSRTPAPQALH